MFSPDSILSKSIDFAIGQLKIVPEEESEARSIIKKTLGDFITSGRII